jgi:outer membrane autotransporter protein
MGDTLYIGANTPGAATNANVVIVADSAATGGPLYLGYAPETKGSLTVQSGASLLLRNAAGTSAQAVTLGTEGNGLLTIDGGTVSASTINVGYFNNMVSSGVGELQITHGGVLNTTGGSVSYVGYARVAASAASSVLIDGPSSVWNAAGDVLVGNGENGAGTITVQNGGRFNITNGGLTLASMANATTADVTIDGPGSAIVSKYEIVVGDKGIAHLSILNGATLQTSSALYDYDYIGQTGQTPALGGYRGEGHVVVDGPGSSWINATGLMVGYAGIGTLTISNGGSVTSTYDSYIGATRGSLGGVWASDAGYGEVLITGQNSIWTTGTLDIAASNGAEGALTVADGGTLKTTDSDGIRVGNGGQGVINIGAPAEEGPVAPGTILADNILLVSAADSVINFNHTAVDEDNYTFSPSISGDGTVNALSGVTMLTGTNTYSGPTTVSGGELKAGAVSAFSPNSDFVVEHTGTLNVNGIGQTVASLVNAGLVNMGTGTAPGTTLTTANYIGQGGVIALNTYLDADNSPTDKLVITGNATGNTSLHITNAGGAGALTIGNGILVVDAMGGATTAEGAFALSGQVVAGPYEYQLFRSGKDGSGPDNWYLRSWLPEPPPVVPPEPPPVIPPEPPLVVPPEPPPVVTPEPPPPPPPEIPHYRVETSVYAALPSLALQYGHNLLDSLHERVGEEEDIRGRADLNNWAPKTGAWARVLATRGQQNGDARGIYGDGPEYNYDFFGLQVGQDLFRKEHDGGSRDHAGLYFAYGHGDSDVTHFDGAHGRNQFGAYTLGGYWTHFGPNGWYTDAIVQGSYYDTTSTANTRLPDLTTHGAGFAASLEGGKPFRFGHGYFIEPQAQLTYQTINFADASDSAARVSFSDADSLVGRIGARFGHDWDLKRERQLTVWLRPNLWREFRGNPITEFSSADGPVPFHSDLGGTWGEINVGISGQATPLSSTRCTASLFANISYNRSFDGDGDAWTGKAGLRFSW